MQSCEKLMKNDAFPCNFTNNAAHCNSGAQLTDPGCTM